MYLYAVRCAAYSRKATSKLQSKDIDLASVPTMVDSTTKRLKEMKDVSSSTWFKDHSMVFTDTAQLGSRNIVVKEEDKSAFLQKVYRPYFQSVILTQEWNQMT